MKMDFAPIFNTVTAALLIWATAQLFENSREITANTMNIQTNRALIERLEGQK